MASPTAPDHLQCKDITISVPARAFNKLLPLDLSALTDGAALSNLLTSVESLGTALVSGDYEIAGTFCSPLRHVAARQDTLQVLVHGITYTRDYWAGPATHDIGLGATNQSWIYYAAQQGYSVLAIDRLCNGKSSHPNGLLECQLPLESAVVANVLDMARNGSLPGIETQFNKIIYVGHSYGSLMGNFIAATNPSAMDQLHLTGFSERLALGASSVLLRPSWHPASLTDPARYSGLDAAYILATSREGCDKVFYHGDMDAAVEDYAWKTRGTVTVGELLTALAGQFPAPGYKSDVFVVNGDADNLFCASDPITALAGKPGACDKYGSTKGVAAYYPAAHRFGLYNVPNTGHSIAAHNTVFASIAASHEFMEEAGF